MFAFQLPGSFGELMLWTGAGLGVVVVFLLVLGMRWFVRAIAGNDDPPEEFEDSPQIISEED